MIFLTVFLITLQQVTEVPPRYSGCWWRETGVSSCVLQHWGSQPLTHCSPFPLQEILPPPVFFSPRQCCLGEEGGGTGKVPLKVSNVSKPLFSPVVCWKLPSGRLDFCQFSLIHELLPRSALSRFFADHGERCGSRFTGSTGSTAHTKVYLPIIICTGGQNSSWAPWSMVLNPTTPTKVLLFVMDV